MPVLNFRDVEEPLVRLLKIQAASLGKGIREYCLDLLAEGSQRFEQRAGEKAIPEVAVVPVLKPVVNQAPIYKKPAVIGSNSGRIMNVHESTEDQDSDEEHMEYCQDPSCRRCKKVRSGR